MNNLTTRKIVLGLLMTLVLAFSVQGIADAQVAVTVTSGDNQTKKVGETFSITLRFTGVSPTVDTGTDNINDAYDVDVSFDAGLTLTTTSGIVTGTNNLRIASPQTTSAYSYTLTYRVDTGTGAGQLTDTTLGNATVYIVPDSDITASVPVLAVGNAGYLPATGIIQINGGSDDRLQTVDKTIDRFAIASVVEGRFMFQMVPLTGGRSVVRILSPVLRRCG